MDSPFKQILSTDVEKVFLNFEEFGESHIINGKKYTIILDDNEEIQRRIIKGAFAYRDGIYTAQKLFYVSAKEFGRLPPVGRNLILDGKNYQITDAVNEAGIYSISLEAIQS